MYPVLQTKQHWVVPAASPRTPPHTHKHMHAPKHAHCNTYVFVWIEQVSSSVLALLSGSKQQCPVDAFRHNSSTSDGSPNSQLRKRDYKSQYDQCVPDSCKYPLKDLKGRIRFLFFNIFRGAAHIVPHPLQQLPRLKSCPTSNYDDRIPHHLPREQTVMFAFPLAALSRNPSVPSGRQNTRTHPKSPSVRVRVSERHIWRATERKRQTGLRAALQMLQLQPLAVGASVCAHAGMGHRALLIGWKHTRDFSATSGFNTQK